MVFQLPYYVFPYASRYDQVKGFLHSDKLRWSYGAVQESSSDLWQRSVSNKPVPQMVQEVAGAGFAAVYINRTLYADNGAAVERELSDVLTTQPIVSSHGKLSLFLLPQHR
jgi:hypothetical protein